MRYRIYHQQWQEVQMQAFRDAVERRDLDAVIALLNEEVLFRSPVVHRPYQGRDQVKPLLRAVGQVLQDFSYTRLIGAPHSRDHALVFRGRIGDRALEGCDFIHVDEQGLIDELYVMIRPLSGLMALAEAMKRQLAEDAGEARPEQTAA
jgi:SnoaL-like domain